MAKKTGFYARQFSQAEARDLQNAGERGLSDEIALLRVAMRRTIELADGVSDLAEMVQALKALSAAAGKLAGLLRAQEQADSSRRPEQAGLLNQELAALAAEYRLAERFTPASAALTPERPVGLKQSLPGQDDEIASPRPLAMTGEPVIAKERSARLKQSLPGQDDEIASLRPLAMTGEPVIAKERSARLKQSLPGQDDEIASPSSLAMTGEIASLRPLAMTGEPVIAKERSARLKQSLSANPEESTDDQG